MSLPSSRPSYSAAALICLALALYLSQLLAPRWETHNVLAVLTWDSLGYYLYLPATFIYHDLGHLGFVEGMMREYAPTGSFYQASLVPETGLMVMKYPIGVALLELPFFYLGHLLAGILGYKTDGFTAPYQIAIACGGTTYGIIGLFLVRRILLRYFTDGIVATTLVLLSLGTNFIQYGVYDTGMAHVYSFALYGLILWLTARFYDQPKAATAAWLGLALGLNVICRPSEMVCALIPILWGLHSVASIKARVAFWQQHWRIGAVLVVGGVLGVLPQLIYWKTVTSHLFFYSYGEQTFSFLKPHLGKVLFSFKKGWLIYTPLMLVAIAGFAWLYRYQRAVFVALFGFFIVNLWVVSAWDIWWYGGSIGQRALVQSYAVMAAPLAGALTWLTQRAKRFYVAVPVLMFLFLLNLFQHWQYMTFLITPENMNRSYYWGIFGRVQATQPILNRLHVPEILPTDRLWTPQLLAEETYETMQEPGVTTERAAAGRSSFYVAPGKLYPPSIRRTAAELGLKPNEWVRASVRLQYDLGAWDGSLVFSIKRAGQEEAYKYLRVPLHSLLTAPRRWDDVWFDAQIPHDLHPDDVVETYVLNEAGVAYFIDDVRLSKLNPSSPVAP